MTDRYAIIGNPIAQSKSPVLQTAFAKQFGHDIDYGRILAPIDGFDAAVREFIALGGRGMNITMPFKLDAFRFADRLTPRARRAGAVNMFTFDAQGTLGDNTDGFGIVRDIMHNLGRELRGARVLLLGAGGAVAGVLEPMLAQSPAELLIANRTASKATDLAQAFADIAGDTRLHGGGFDSVQGSWDILINGSASSMTGELPPLPTEVWNADTLVYDMAYKPEPTVFLRAAQAAGVRQVADGLGMVVEQGGECFALWRGVRPDTRPVLEMLKAERGW